MIEKPSLLESPPVQAGLCLTGAGAILGSVWMFTSDARAVGIIAIGMIAVAVMLLAYRALVKWSRARRAKPLERGLADNSLASPAGINEPARRARLDDLRRNFDTGVGKFRAAGKNLYSYPWYVLVGEPGSGKTEAIRHCGVGFPPGLQDQLQGAGGTLNMNWWFTNHAIILDTAGRLMFEEVPPGSTNEWQEFLKLLRQTRPLCPINGMLLVIPVDTLMTDPQDEIQKKAGRIAQQLDQIQRALGVRFPVFVVITKCDLISGFNEFFNTMNDPAEQSQILGWSNPNPLDVAFNSEAVDQHLEVVRQRLLKHRQRLLLDPVHTEDPAARRLDQVDALYGLPDAIVKIGPRLKMYLETIFVAGEWSAKPLFLRGIYFTCAMQKGAALDLELAQALGVPVSQLPQGPVWQRDRAYFLRDLFLKKVFAEKGLVTRASNTAKLRRRRKMAVLATGFLAAITLGVFTWLGARDLNERIGSQSNFWSSAKTQYETNAPGMAIVMPAGGGYVYQNNPVKMWDRSTIPVDEFRAQGEQLVRKSISIPWVFKPVAALSGNLDETRRAAYRTIFESSVLVPVINAARARMAGESAVTWQPQPQLAMAALTQLMKLERQSSEYGSAGKLGVTPDFDLDPLMRYILPAEEYQKYEAKDRKSVRESIQWIYSRDGAGGAWPTGCLAAGSPAAAAAIDKGIAAFVAWEASQMGAGSSQLLCIAGLRESLTSLKALQADIARLATSNPVETLVDYNKLLQTWGPLLKRFCELRQKLDSGLKALDAAVGAGASSRPLVEVYQAEVQRQIALAGAEYQKLLALIPDAVKDRTDSSSAILRAAREKIQKDGIDKADAWKATASSSPAVAELTAGQPLLAMITAADGAARRLYEWQASSCLLVNRQLPDAPDPLATTSQPATMPAPPADQPLRDVLGGIDKTIALTGTQVDAFVKIEPVSEQFKGVGGCCRFMLEQGSRCQRYYAVDAVISRAPATADGWAEKVKARPGAADSEKLICPVIPLTQMGSAAAARFDARFSPDAAAAEVEQWNAVADELPKADRRPGDPVRLLEADALRRRYDQSKGFLETYKSDYVTYWGKTVFADLRIQGDAWKDFRALLGPLQPWKANDALGKLAEQVIYALGKMKDAAGVKRIETALAAQGRGFKDQCDTLVTSWRDLGDDSATARYKILARKPGDFLKSYCLIASGDTEGFIAEYWGAVGRQGLRLLAADAETQVRHGLESLGKYRRFPLAAPKENEQELTVEEVAAAREAIKLVRGGIFDAKAASSAAGGDQTIAQGGNTGDKWTDDQLDRLRGVSVMGDQAALVKDFSQRLTALPEPGAPPLACKISAVKEDNSVADMWPWIALVQPREPGKVDPRTVKMANLRAAPSPELLLTADYPGNPVVLVLAKGPNIGIDQTVVLRSERWAALRLLYGSRARQDGPNAAVWNVQLGVKTGNEPARALNLKLEFNRELHGFAD